jgi:hypothetical protein
MLSFGQFLLATFWKRFIENESMLATSSLGFQNIKIKLTIIYNNMLIKESFSFCYEKLEEHLN